MGETKALRVGVVGAPIASWGGHAHVPAIQALPNLELAAVCTSRRASAEAAAVRFGASRWFTDARELAECPDVDAVIIAVKVPAHDELVRAVLGAGKHVYCEWPLARDADQAKDLAKLAEAAGVHHAIGLQARSSPALNYMRTLVADGFVGEVQSCVGVALLGMGADPIPAQYAYLYDLQNAANPLTIATGHLVDALCFIVGEPDAITGFAAPRKPEVLIEGGTSVAATTPDTVACIATLAGGCVLTSHVSQARVAAPRTRVEITGSDGVIVIEASEPAWEGADPIIQISPLQVFGATREDRRLKALDIPERYRWVPADVPAGPAFNVAQALGRFASDIESDRRSVPDFHLAVRRHRLLDALWTASQTGRRQHIETET